MVFMKREALSSMYLSPLLYVLNFKSQLQLSVVNHPAPTTISKIHNKLAPPPYLGENHCLVSLQGLRLLQRPY